ncbi:MAG: hypothetical protein JWM85_3635 [Acidimicrobiaceae bacterium]|nr:hypothetical protein [Acidimicrobiaceae bacterium]
MKLHIDGVETEVPGVALDNGMSIYVDHAGQVRATRTEQPPPPPPDEQNLTADQKRIRDLEAQLAAKNAPADNADGTTADEN